MRRPGVVFAAKDGSRDPRLERVWKTAMAGRRERPLEHVWEQAMLRRVGAAVDTPPDGRVVIDLTDNTLATRDGEPSVDVREQAPSADPSRVLPLPAMGDEPTDAPPAAEAPAGPIDGSEPQPGPEWTHGIDGNWYPPPPRRGLPMPDNAPVTTAHAKRRRVSRALGIFGALFLVAAIGAMVVGIVATIRSYEETEPVSLGAISGHSVGSTQHTDDIDVTVVSANDPYTGTGALDGASPGAHPVAIEVELRNTTFDRNIVMSSALQMTLTDAKGSNQAVTVVSSLDSVDGTLAPQGVRRGFVVFRVADGSPTPLQLRVKGSLSAGGVTFTIP